MKSKGFLTERWKSSDNHQEVHFFKKDDQRGQAYVLGFNPKYVNRKTIKSILKEIKDNGKV